MESTAELEAMLVSFIMGIPPIIGLLRNIRNEPEPQNIPLKPFPTFRLAFDDAIEKSYKFIQFIFGSKIISSHLFVSSFLINLLVVLIFMAFGIINDAM